MRRKLGTGDGARLEAVDTDVLARFFIDDPDDPEAADQRPLAAAALSQRAFVPLTVVLEFEWLMRGFYRLPTAQTVAVLRALCGIGHLTLEDRDAVLVASDACEHGLDFADALHLARSSRASAFLSFDQRLAKRAAAAEMAPPVELLRP